MREDFISYLWKFRKYDFLNSKTLDGEALEIMNPGAENFDSGPDFFNAQIRIGEQLWAGNVEIHVKSSDWYFHNHEKDPNYDNVILHVVWEDDADIFRKDQSKIPTLLIRNYTESNTVQNYQKLLETQHYQLNCETELPSVSGFIKEHWLENLYFERLSSKYESILALLNTTENDWENVLFVSLSRSFGLKVNADAFESLAKSIDYKIIRKLAKDKAKLEALFLGQAGLIKSDDKYAREMAEEFDYLKRKFQLGRAVIKPSFFRLRPDNFPTIRLSQLAMLYARNTNLFQEILKCTTIEDYYSLLSVEAGEYWNTHYTFGKAHTSKAKRLSKNFLNLLLINGIIPLLYAYYRYIGEDRNDFLYSLISGLPAEQNSVTGIYRNLNHHLSENAMQSQALIQLKKHYCDRNLCLKCEWGVGFLQK